MLHDLPSFRSRCASAVALEDITMILAVRLHEGNAWVAERLAAMRDHYRTMCPTLVVDFGSSDPYRSRLREICAASGFEYIYEDDAEVFSLAKARNLGARACSTRLLFFNDVDCFGGPDFFAQLAAHADQIEMGTYLEQIIDLPVYHFGEEMTQEVWKGEARGRGDAILRAMTRMAYAEYKARAYSFVDPSSNFFVIRREFFELVGGYNENFRGHGSEDFEFFLRLAHYTQQFPLPQAPSDNVYSPINATFFGVKRYRGFRRYMELMAHRTECAGLRIAHLNHPRGEGAWYAQGDRDKKRLGVELSGFLQSPGHLIERDWLSRDKSALVLLRHERQYAYFLPLRLMGYRLHLMMLGDPAAEARATALIARGDVDCVAVFNPYMSSHKELSPWIEQARARGTPLLIVDRGMLPDSWFYAADMPYGDPDYRQLDLDRIPLTSAELEVADAYAAQLRAGGATLEQNGDFVETLERFRHTDKELTVLIPLQLPDDVAVTRFNEGYQAYPEFLAELVEVTRAYPRTRFLIKTHPLANEALAVGSENAVICHREANIHALIELSDAVVCYNSGVGFLVAIHGKPLLTVGNAFYNLDGIGTRAATLVQAVEFAHADRKAPSPLLLTRFLAWHLFRKYAFFKATSELQQLAVRQAHHYRDLEVYHLPDGHLTALRASSDYPFHAHSYAGAKLGISARPFLGGLAWDERFAPMRKLRKLVRDPKAFARDSKLGRLIAKRIPR